MGVGSITLRALVSVALRIVALLPGVVPFEPTALRFAGVRRRVGQSTQRIGVGGLAAGCRFGALTLQLGAFRVGQWGQRVDSVRKRR